MATYHVIIPIGLKPSPNRYEITAAELLASYFKTDVEFIPRSNYQTPDFKINNDDWELKSPTGTGKNNVERQLQSALKQSQNIVFDARRSKIHITTIRSELNRQFQLAKSIKRLILIDKNKNVVELAR
jgi:hypothetical protein